MRTLFTLNLKIPLKSNLLILKYFLLEDDYAKYTSKDLDDYDAEYDLLPDKKDRKRHPKKRVDIYHEGSKTKSDGFWLNKQMQKLSHHTKGIKLDATSDPKQGCHGNHIFIESFFYWFLHLILLVYLYSKICFFYHT